jgi:hypothetical protein
MNDVADALSDIAELLTVCKYGGQRKIALLQNWSRVLAGAPSQQEALQVLQTVKGVLAGLNSLSDIDLQPPTDSGYTAREANQELNRRIAALGKQVYGRLGI